MIKYSYFKDYDINNRKNCLHLMFRSFEFSIYKSVNFDNFHVLFINDRISWKVLGCYLQ